MLWALVQPSLIYLSLLTQSHKVTLALERALCPAQVIIINNYDMDTVMEGQAH